MNAVAEIVDHNPIGREEIEWIKSKHEGIEKTGIRVLKEAIEIGEWFVQAQDRMGVKDGSHKSRWHLWLGAMFPRIHTRTVRNYMRLARGREYLEQQGSWELNSREPINITRALTLLTDRDRKNKVKPLELPPSEFEEPLLLLRDELKSYVYQQWQLEYNRAQIKFRIKNAKLGRRQIRQAIEWATQEHPEVKEMVLKAFL